MKKLLAILVAAIALSVWTVPAMADVKFGGQYRLRAESRSATTFDESDIAVSDDQSFYGQRVRLWGTANPTNDVAIKLTIQDTRVWGLVGENAGGGPALTDDSENHLDLHEAYLEVKDFFGTPVTLKVGRQELAYGDERLVGSFGWSNNGRSFDALKVSLPVADVGSLDVWTAKLDEDNFAALEADEDVDFYGVYFTTKAIPDNTLDLYVLWTRDGAATGINDIDADIKTYGLRLAGSAVGIDYTAELPFQTGEAYCAIAADDVCDVDADAFAVKLGYAIPGGPMGLKVGLEYDFASGGTPPTAANPDVETFYNIYPTNHDKYGTMDQQAWRNVQAWNINASIKPNDKLTARLDYWDFSLDEEKDGWYTAANWNGTAAVGGLRGTCAACTDDEIGQEIDITLNYKYNDALGIMAGLSQFMTGDAIEERVAGDDEEDQTWAFVQLTANF